MAGDMTILSRRKFFAASAGAAVATPRLAGDLRNGGSLLGGALVSRGTDASSTGHPDGLRPHWVDGERSRLEKLARGDFSGEFDYDTRPAGDPAVDNIDALRSVSMSAKRSMANDLAQRRGRENRQRHAKHELGNLIKQWFS
jgi:hypothetical protein